MRDVITARGPGLDLPGDVIGRHAATLDVARHRLGEGVHITMNGVALHELHRGLRRREHILVGGEVLERPSVDHSGGGGGGWIRNVGVVSEGNEIRGGRVLQMVEVKLLVALCARLQGRRLVSGASGRRGLKALGDLRLVRFRSGPRERSRPEAVTLLKAHGCSRLRLEPLGPPCSARLPLALGHLLVGQLV